MWNYRYLPSEAFDYRGSFRYQGLIRDLYSDRYGLFAEEGSELSNSSWWVFQGSINQLPFSTQGDSRLALFSVVPTFPFSFISIKIWNNLLGQPHPGECELPARLRHVNRQPSYVFGSSISFYLPDDADGYFSVTKNVKFVIGSATLRDTIILGKDILDSTYIHRDRDYAVPRLVLFH